MVKGRNKVKENLILFYNVLSFDCYNGILIEHNSLLWYAKVVGNRHITSIGKNQRL
jgi:hypothetical protein